MLADNNIAATQILKVISKGAERANNGIRIPSLFIFNAFAFNSALPKEIIEIDRESITHRHQRFGSAFAGSIQANHAPPTPKKLADKVYAFNLQNANAQPSE